LPSFRAGADVTLIEEVLLVKKIGILSLFGVIVLALATFRADAQSGTELPRLVVQITIDQLRGDLPLRYQARFSDGGFRYFLDHGTWYVAANHPHAFTETVVGHTTLATGAYPSRHGMIGNKWYDRETGTVIENVVDAAYPTVGDDKPRPGAAPSRILTTTFSDELNIAMGGHSRIFAVSLKDRAAVPMAGHTGKAFWYSMKTGCFVTSTFYYSALPAWVKSWCDTKPIEQYRTAEWKLLYDRDTYFNRDVTNIYPPNTPPETNMAMLADTYAFGRTFPHKLGAIGKAPNGGPADYLSQNLTISPQGDEFTLEFTKKLIHEEQLGRHESPDYLAISFSATDYLTHWFSSVSLESEDNVLRLDRTLQKLLAYLDKEVGLDRILLVLSADHGGLEYPEYLLSEKVRVPSGRLLFSRIETAARDALKAQGPEYEGLLLAYQRPYLYLDWNLIEQRKLSRAVVERIVAKAVMKLPGITVAVPSSDMAGDSEADQPLTSQLRRNFEPRRSGDVYVVQAPQWQIDDEIPPANAAFQPLLLEHDAPWAYDTFVPVAFAGFGVPAGKVTRRIDTTAVAATLSSALRTKFPSGCIGEPLAEVLGRE
jgi:type I phosphodiesterase/nucleotide pyrophosphatase